jgi:hypothetical protein
MHSGSAEFAVDYQFLVDVYFVSQAWPGLAWFNQLGWLDWLQRGLVGWLVGRIADWLVGWLVGCNADWLVKSTLKDVTIVVG